MKFVLCCCDTFVINISINYILFIYGITNIDNLSSKNVYIFRGFNGLE